VFNAAHRAVLGAGKHLVYVCPPAAWAVTPLFAAVDAPDEAPSEPGAVSTLVVANSTAEADDLRVALTKTSFGALHVVTGCGRAERKLRGGTGAEPPQHLAATGPDIMELVGRAALKLDRVSRIVLLWPELSLAGQHDTLDTILAETSSAQRLIITSDPAGLADLLERHARRAPVAVFSSPPQQPSGEVRYAITDPAHRRTCAVAVLDVTNQPKTLVWDPGTLADLSDLDLNSDVRVCRGLGPPEDVGSHDLAIAMDLPSGEILQTLQAAVKEVVVLLRPTQLQYLERLAQPATALPLPSEVDRARDQAAALRAQVRDQVARNDWGGQLMAIEPLLAEFDPTVIAAAVLAGVQHTPAAPATATWTRVRISAGRTDQIRPGDVVGMLLNSVGLRRADVGRIDVRDRFTLVEVRPTDAERVVRELNGASIRGSRVGARLDHK
jgi:hypothetical protein